MNGQEIAIACLSGVVLVLLGKTVMDHRSSASLPLYTPKVSSTSNFPIPPTPSIPSTPSTEYQRLSSNDEYVPITDTHRRLLFSGKRKTKRKTKRKKG